MCSYVIGSHEYIVDLPKKTQQQFGSRYFITCYLQGIVMGTEYY